MGGLYPNKAAFRLGAKAGAGESHFLGKHRENRKMLPREHLIRCRGVKLFLLKDSFKDVIKGNKVLLSLGQTQF